MYLTSNIFYLFLKFPIIHLDDQILKSGCLGRNLVVIDDQTSVIFSSEVRPSMKLGIRSSCEPCYNVYFSKGLTNRKAYKPPPDVEARIERLTSMHCEDGQDWRQLELTDPTLKYKVSSLKLTDPTLKYKVSSLKLTDPTLKYKVSSLELTDPTLKYKVSSLELTDPTLKYKVSSLELTDPTLKYKVSYLELINPTLKY